VIGNLVHEVGVYGKQVCAYVQSLACETELIGNVFFNGPRAGINFNDGFGGGNLLKNNLVFNFVRETLDHGTFNSWDRQPYITKVKDGKAPSLIPAESYITQNLFVGNYHSLWPIDHDDGSCYYTDTENVIAYGGFKNFAGHTVVVTGNLYIYPDAPRPTFNTTTPHCAMSYGNTRNAFNGSGWDDVWGNNVCVIGNPDVFQYPSCSTFDDAGLVPMSFDNVFYAPNATIYVSCYLVRLTLEEFQEMGYEIGSVVKDLPSNEEVIEWAKNLLQIK